MPALLLLLLLLLSIETLISFGPWHSVSFYCRIDAPECSGARREVRCIYYWFRYIILVLCNDKYLTLLSRQIRWDFDWSVAFFFPFFSTLYHRCCNLIRRLVAKTLPFRGSINRTFTFHHGLYKLAPSSRTATGASYVAWAFPPAK